MRVFCAVFSLSACCPSPEGSLGQVRSSEVAFIAGQHGWSVNRPKQRKLFVIDDQLWLFYANGQSLNYVRSDDGVTWSASTAIRPAHFGHRFGLAYDGQYVHYAVSQATPGYDVFYRRGLPGIGGDIAWQDEQVVFEVADNRNVLYPNVVVGGDGVPWVSFLLFEGGDHTLPGDGVVTRARSADGVWQTAAGFPHRLVDDNRDTFPEPVGAARDDGSLLWIYNRDGAGYFARLWAHDEWGPEETITTASHEHSLFASLAVGDDVHVTYGGDAVFHRHRDASGVWSAEFEIAGGCASGHTGLTQLGADNFAVTLFEKDSTRFLYRTWSAGDWQNLYTLSEHADGVPSADKGWNFNVLDRAGAGFAGALAVTTGNDDASRLQVFVVGQQH